jgi:hypothetical protein
MLALTSPKSGGHSVGVVRLRTEAKGSSFSLLIASLTEQCLSHAVCTHVRMLNQASRQEDK